MTSVPELVGPDRDSDVPGAPDAPLDVRDPELFRALVETVAVLGADFRPRTLLGAEMVRFGFNGAGDLGARLADWVHPDEHQMLGEALNQCGLAPGIDVEVRARVRNDVEGWHTITLHFQNLLEHPDVQGILVRAVDHTVFEREARWRTLVSESPIGICEVDRDDLCVFVNGAFERLTGVSASDALGGGWCRAIHSEDVEQLRLHQQVAARGGDTRPCQVRLTAPDGALRWVSARWVPLHGEHGELSGFLGTFEDVTERRRLEEQLEYDATHDRLTGLGSRALLVEQLNAALAHTRRGAQAVALLFIDLDGFKRVNDMLGHAAGDDLLVSVAERLRKALRESDVCVRLGGDEFVVCCADMESLSQSTVLADRLLAIVSEPYDIHGHEVLLGASIGIATAQGDDPLSADQLLSNADIASYRAKRRGRGRVEVFDDELRRKLAQGRRVSRSVARMLDAPRVPLLCTPIAVLDDHTIVGFDCTVDWSQGGLDDAEVIDHIVEEAGMSREVDVAVVRTLLAYLVEWQRELPGQAVPGLSTALTRAGALSPVLPELVRDMIGRSRVNPSLLWIGIPESAMAHDFHAASRVAAALDELKVGVALRDFGSAISSLEQLRTLPTPTMTVAGPLVAALHGEGDEVSATLLGAIVKYARALGRIVVANGVIDAEHAARLHDLGCAFGSGPAFGPTVAIADVPALLASRA